MHSATAKMILTLLERDDYSLIFYDSLECFRENPHVMKYWYWI